MRPTLSGRLVLLFAFVVGSPMAAVVYAQQSETVESYGQDVIRSIRIVFDGNGTVLARQDYMPFGTSTLAAAGMPPQTFGGQERDDETSQLYFHARSFQPRLGRFEQPDPMAAGLFASGNQYSFARGNPLVFVDPLGLSECKVFAGKVRCDETVDVVGKAPPPPKPSTSTTNPVLIPIASSISSDSAGASHSNHRGSVADRRASRPVTQGDQQINQVLSQFTAGPMAEPTGLAISVAVPAVVGAAVVTGVAVVPAAVAWGNEASLTLLVTIEVNSPGAIDFARDAFEIAVAPSFWGDEPNTGQAELAMLNRALQAGNKLLRFMLHRGKGVRR